MEQPALAAETGDGAGLENALPTSTTERALLGETKGSIALIEFPEPRAPRRRIESRRRPSGSNEQILVVRGNGDSRGKDLCGKAPGYSILTENAGLHLLKIDDADPRQRVLTHKQVFAISG